MRAGRPRSRRRDAPLPRLPTRVLRLVRSRAGGDRVVPPARSHARRRPHAPPGEGEAGGSHLAHRRAESRRFVRPEAGTRQAAWQGARNEGDAGHLLRPVRAAAEGGLAVQEAWQERPGSVGVVPAHRRVCRRPDRHPLHARRLRQPHAGALPANVRVPVQRVPQRRGVGELRAGERGRRPAGVCGAARPAGAAERRGVGLEQRVLAGGARGGCCSARAISRYGICSPP